MVQTLMVDLLEPRARKRTTSEVADLPGAVGLCTSKEHGPPFLYMVQTLLVDLLEPRGRKRATS